MKTKAKEKLANVQMYGRRVSEFLLPDQMEFIENAMVEFVQEQANGVQASEATAILPHVSGSLPDKFKDIIRFIESDLMEVKLYGNDGFDNQEELDGKEYLARLIKDAVGNDR